MEREKMSEKMIEEEIEEIKEDDYVDGSKKLVGFIITLKCSKCGKEIAKYSIEYPEYNNKQLLYATGCNHYRVAIWAEIAEFALLNYKMRQNSDDKEWVEYRNEILHAVKEIEIGKNTILILPVFPEKID